VRLRAFFAAAVLLAMATSAQAVQLVVMATNTTAIPGDKVYTIGVQVTSADLAAPGVGSNPVLFVQHLSFPSTSVTNGLVIQAAGANNKSDLQSVQSVGLDPQFPGPYTGGAATQLYKDSWWYNSAGANGDAAGILDGQIADDGTTGPITNNPFVGPTAYVWQPQTDGIQGGVTATPTMTYTGIYGPLTSGANNQYLDQQPLAAQFVNGILTVPLAQIVATGTVPLNFDYAAGQGQFLSVGQNPYDWLGAPAATPGLPIILDFTNNTIHRVPEPGTFALAGMGALGLVLAWRRRK
jgi:hypothetical protein